MIPKEIKLNFRKYGEGEKNLIIIHGLFGSLDNWASLAKRFANYFTVYTLDLRNHGLSPHTEEFSIKILSDDLELFIQNHIGKPVSIIGHSLGGKVAMHIAINNPYLIEKLIVADIGPQEYPPHHQLIIEMLKSLDLTKLKSRKEAEILMFEKIESKSMAQFLLKNLAWNAEGEFRWKFNLDAISKNILEVGKAQEGICTKKTLFLRGELAGYINSQDFAKIYEQFPFSDIETLPNTGHWLHAEQPELFFNLSISFLLDK
jgi:pimeloyl-ACP methyl ester carboxylesterase